MYAGAPLSLAAFRTQVPETSRPYRMPGATVLGPLAFIVANLVIYWSGFEAVWKLGIAIVTGYVLIGICMAFDKDRPPLNWKAAQWLPVYLIGVGVISWQGQYSGGAVAAPVNTGRIPFWWDMLAVTVFSLVIYYWAQRTKLPREAMLHVVNRQGAMPTHQLHG
jgi:amino acid transporter